jgi:hypothetical protein
MGKPVVDIHKVQVYGSGSHSVESPGEPHPNLPSSWIFSGPTCSGKTQAWLTLILNVYRGAWDRIFVFSPSILIDDSYVELRKYLDKMSSDPQKEKLYYEDMDMGALGKILDDQRAICEFCKKQGRKCPEILIVVDDMADRADVLNRRQAARNQGGSHMVTLGVRGRHLHISWMCSTQCLNLISLPIRKNVRNILVWRARSAREIECICEELAAVYDKQTLLKFYETAVNDEPYSFLNVKLDAQDRRDMFWLRWQARLLPEEDPSIQESDDDDGQQLEQRKREVQPKRKSR